MKNFIILSLTLLLASSCSTSIPAPDLKKENESLLMIPSSVNFEKLSAEALDWSIKFKNILSNEVVLVSFNQNSGEEFIVTDLLLPGSYVAEEFLHPEHGMDFIIKASVDIQKEKNDLNESKKLRISSIPINIENKKINIPNFKFVYFEEKRDLGGYMYFGYLKEITPEERNSFISKIRNVENFNKWGLGVKN